MFEFASKFLLDKHNITFLGTLSNPHYLSSINISEGGMYLELWITYGFGWVVLLTKYSKCIVSG